MADLDPLTQTYDYIWELVEGFPPWADAVRVGNRLRLDDTKRDPLKDTLKAADLPQVILLPTDGANNLHSNSSSSVITQNFTIGISSGEQRVNEVYFPLKFYTLQALACFRQSLGNLTWKSYPFLKKLEIPTSTDSLDEFGDLNIISWESLITISAEMWFPNTLFTQE